MSDDEFARGWYDRGGIFKPGVTLVCNATGTAEMVRAMRDYMRDNYGDGATGTDGTAPESPDA